MSQPLLRQEEENKLSQDALLVTCLHKKHLESRVTEISSADCVGGKQQMLPERGQSENSFKKVGHAKLKIRK